MRLSIFGLLLLAALVFATSISREGPMQRPNEGIAEVLKAPAGKAFWPKPQQLKITEDLLPIDVANFKITSNLKNCKILTRAIARYHRRYFDERCGSGTMQPPQFPPPLDSNITAINTLNIVITDRKCPMYPPSQTSEFYTLEVGPVEVPESNKIVLGAMTVWGALRGLETLSQAIIQDNSSQWSIYRLNILDYPRYPFRGLLLDTSRHYLPVQTLLTNLDAMEMNKMNVFHWHIVDDTSFPYVSTKFPNLSNKGAFDTRTRIYSPADVQEVINYAADRGIRVIPEFDTPGHTMSWGPGQPGLLTECYKNGKPDGTHGPINPILPSTYTFIESFLSEITSVFKDDYFHVGGDEVSFKCWKSNPDLQEFMKKQGYGDDYAKLESYYINKVLELMKELKRNTIVWQEVFDNKVELTKETIVHVWKAGKSMEEIARATKKGHRVIYSSPWYLNYISYGKDWTKYYEANPHNFTGTPAQKELVMGGEACMWGEFVDRSNVISRTWPRASAVAERLWSASDVTNLISAERRLESHRCRMIK
ncbi:HEXB [Cordylochernes scorpioides]|uniref:Beta-hexosaminidase n=1 Tax=Cordylochernes scorpioides TaxID=51811 RepID=A0ABY6L6R1_9ARAC|nr:HEXB [Cordylochernes scorpioides]